MGDHFFFRDGCIITQGDLGIEAVREHTFVCMHQLIIDAHVAELQGWQFDKETVVPHIQPGFDKVDQFDRALVTSPSLEEFLLASPYRAILELAFDNL
jgi:hypothetical protein